MIFAVLHSNIAAWMWRTNPGCDHTAPRFQPMWNAQNPLGKQYSRPSPSRPDRTVNAADITKAVPAIHDPTTCNRHVDALNPEYRLAGYEELAQAPPRAARELRLNVADIDGAQPVSAFASRGLHGIPQVRGAGLDVRDINRVRRPHDYLHPRTEAYHNLRTDDVVAAVKPFARRSPVDPLAPTYCPPATGNFGPTRSPFRNMDYRAHTANLRTDDVDGVVAERSRKLRFKYGGRDEVVDLNYTADITRRRQGPVRLTQDAAFMADRPTSYGADQLGQERHAHTAGGTRICGRTYGSPDFMHTGAAGTFQRPDNVQRVQSEAGTRPVL